VVGLEELAGEGVDKKFEAPINTSAPSKLSGTQLFEYQTEKQTAKCKE
jgi:hypothetical protein